MGPVQIMLLEFEDFRPAGIAEELLALSDAGTIRVLSARFVVKDDEGDIAVLSASDLSDDEQADLRAAAGALIGLGAGAVLGGEEGAEAGLELGAEAGWVGGGLTDEDIADIGEDLEPGEALLMLVLELCWAEGLRDAFRDAGVVGVHAHFVTPEGLIALGALLGAAASEED
jgi:hypothetical protein